MGDATATQTIFFWGETLQGSSWLCDPHPERCPYCGEFPRYLHECSPATFPSYGRLPHYEKKASVCPLCGWYISVQAWPTDATSKGPFLHRAALLGFDLNSPSIPLGILGAYLREHFSAIYNLDWRRFEELTADVFREHGYSVILTKRTRDRGADLIILNNDRTGARAIVECKRLSRHRTVGVALVRELVGACVDWETQEAVIVTTGSFSTVARAAPPRYATRGYKIRLIDAYEFLCMLGVYNEKLPPLNLLSERIRREIAECNRRMLRLE
ncbi:MAG: restriction endonuclease [Phycisphaerales bacterium]|nr:MAG: restriction endonuclease [Phycisphaerales bacterium]